MRINTLHIISYIILIGHSLIIWAHCPVWAARRCKFFPKKPLMASINYLNLIKIVRAVFGKNRNFIFVGPWEGSSYFGG
jgi:hypothetical protein